MKEFFKKYGYTTIKMLVYQIALSLFGWALATAAIAAGRDGVKVVSAIFTILFYLVLIYVMIWQEGARDRISADYNKIPRRPYFGAFLGLVASVPNLVLFLFIAVGEVVKGLAGFSGACKVIALLVEGVYVGLLSLKVGTAPLSSFWWSYLLITLPLIATCYLSYLAGFNNFRILPQSKKQK